jgi:group I intron endonuclease
MNIYSIYKVTNKINNKVYIGFCCNFQKRIYRHKYNSTILKKNQHFYNAMRKYGFENFSFEEIYSSVEKKHCLSVMEPYFIQEYKSDVFGYNMTSGGEGCFSYKHTEETKKLLSIQNKKNIGSKNGFYGKKHKKETIENNRLKNISIQTEKTGKQIYQYSLDNQLLTIYNSVRSAAKALNKSHPSIIMCCKGKLKHAHGYIWRYAD